ncbi:hypothetical protein [Celeribacter marinus]|uniref:hypothetical protein n=1 Tax=Celeribacter marinus TaxID=1397108 RepID=UPI00317ACFBB
MNIEQLTAEGWPHATNDRQLYEQFLMWLYAMGQRDGYWEEDESFTELFAADVPLAEELNWFLTKGYHAMVSNRLNDVISAAITANPATSHAGYAMDLINMISRRGSDIAVGAKAGVMMINGKMTFVVTVIAFPDQAKGTGAVTLCCLADEVFSPVEQAITALEDGVAS